MGGLVIVKVGGTYTILDTGGHGTLKGLVGSQLIVEEILEGAPEDFLYVQGSIEGRRGKFTLWARLGKPKVGLCRCPYMTFPHKRTPKCITSA